MLKGQAQPARQSSLPPDAKDKANGLKLWWVLSEQRRQRIIRVILPLSGALAATVQRCHVYRFCSLVVMNLLLTTIECVGAAKLFAS